MDKKPKARRDKSAAGGATKATKPQGARFIEFAREHGVDESGREFERAIKKITKSSPKRV
jgi:hypothetical protein